MITVKLALRIVSFHRSRNAGRLACFHAWSVEKLSLFFHAGMSCGWDALRIDCSLVTNAVGLVCLHKVNVMVLVCCHWLRNTVRLHTVSVVILVYFLFSLVTEYSMSLLFPHSERCGAGLFSLVVEYSMTLLCTQ